ncbi:hypothetical protein SCHPADRAFT_911959 [Schizopora paradoxa]|uniref:Uncharacterized protein n=1 Tax=Schizopora paradoxa TaxID=27342 RepID=A0A0H2RG06_9AGAM|nr:hypothetical protein SCHPADRAFT_911959 [Schizopora paradoxa]
MYLRVIDTRGFCSVSQDGQTHVGQERGVLLTSRKPSEAAHRTAIHTYIVGRSPISNSRGTERIATSSSAAML